MSHRVGPGDPPRPHLDRAMDLMSRAVAGGYRDLAYIRADRALDSLRTRPDFQLPMMDLALPDRPIAR